MQFPAVSAAPRWARAGLTPRAVAGGTLVALAFIGVAQAHAAAGGPPPDTFVAAARTVAPGTVLGPDDLALVAGDLPPATIERTFAAPDELVGARTLAPLAPGEPLLASQVAPAATPGPPGPEVAVAVPAERALAGDLRPGEAVDLLASFPVGPTRPVAADALVLAVGRPGDGLLAGPTDLVLTLRLPDADDLTQVVAAVDNGRLTVVRPGANR